MSQAPPVVIDGGDVVTPSGVVEGGRVVISGDRIVTVDETTAAVREATHVDATGRYVLPGLVDLHGDDVEQHLFPRSDARVGTDTALATAEREDLAAGVTTKFHAVAFEESPAGNRSIAAARDLSEAIDERRSRLDARLHARCQLTDPDSVAAVVELCERGLPDLVSLMMHVPGEGQFHDRAAFARYYNDSGEVDPSVEWTIQRRRSVPDDAVRDRARRVAAAARSCDAALASHDDATVEDVEVGYDHGVDICEYPVTTAAARRASELGLTTAMGAPNLTRGGSLYDNLDAETAIEAGVVDALCSDYHPQSLLEAAFEDTGEPLSRRVARVTAAPADAAGLPNRGRLAAGQRADVIVVDPSPVPTVDVAVVGGEVTYRLSGPRH